MNLEYIAPETWGRHPDLATVAQSRNEMRFFSPKWRARVELL
jgi:hypothetical protein